MTYKLNADAALLQPIQVGDTAATNRLFMAPLTRSRADADGTPSPLAAQYYTQRAGAGLIIAGVNPGTAEVLRRGGLDDLLGDDGIVPATDRVFGALDIAVERGRAWVAAQDDGDLPQRDSN